jgi:hypothetical protein
VRLQALGRLKKANYLTWNRTLELPAFSLVLQRSSQRCSPVLVCVCFPQDVWSPHSYVSLLSLAAININFLIHYIWLLIIDHQEISVGFPVMFQNMSLRSSMWAPVWTLCVGYSCHCCQYLNPAYDLLNTNSLSELTVLQCVLDPSSGVVLVFRSCDDAAWPTA